MKNSLSKAASITQVPNSGTVANTSSTTGPANLLHEALANMPDLKKLMEKLPLHSPVELVGIFTSKAEDPIRYPEHIWVYCDTEECAGVRRHAVQSVSHLAEDDGEIFSVFRYRCTDCEEKGKVIGVRFQRSKQAHRYRGTCTKVFQVPQIGGPIPRKFNEAIGQENRDLFLKARASIARGLGIGAYSYYRRIVENKKFNLVTTIRKIAEQTNASKEQIEALKQAEVERQFLKSVTLIKDSASIPAVLLIDGHNPLTVLHDLLSSGIHELSDEECLDRAKHAETILIELVERINLALTNKKEVTLALQDVLQRRKSSGNTV